VGADLYNVSFFKCTSCFALKKLWQQFFLPELA